MVVLTASSGQKTHLGELELKSSNYVVYSCGPRAEEVQLAVVNTNFSVLLDCLREVAPPPLGAVNGITVIEAQTAVEFQSQIKAISDKTALYFPCFGGHMGLICQYSTWVCLTPPS